MYLLVILFTGRSVGIWVRILRLLKLLKLRGALGPVFGTGWVDL